MIGGQRAHHIEQQARRQDNRAGVSHLGLQWNSQSNLHVRRQQLRR
jgi:hypothetical protein